MPDCTSFAKLRSSSRAGCVLACLAATGTLMAAVPVPENPLDRIPALVPDVQVYKTVNGRPLKLFVYNPPQRAAAAPPRGAILFIHGGGWGAGAPDLFDLHCRYFAARGLVAMSVQYRLTSQTNVTPFECVADVKSAMRWIRSRAKALGIDPQRIAAAGDSAGGHLAAAVGVLPDLDDPADDLAVSARADAMILYNPVIDTAPPDGWNVSTFCGGTGAVAVARARALSPTDHVRPQLPPTLLMHGTEDTCTPIRWSERFAERMRAAGNAIEFVELPGKKHAFIIRGYGDDRTLIQALRTTDQFLAEAGYLQGAPTLEELPPPPLPLAPVPPPGQAHP